MIQEAKTHLRPCLSDVKFFLLALMIPSVGHILFTQRLRNSEHLKSFNWAFDFDASRFVRIWCDANWGAEDLSLGWLARHPLIMTMRPMCRGLVHLGMFPGEAALIVSAVIAGANVAMCYVLGRVLQLARVDAMLLALWFSMLAQPLFLSAIPEAYGLAMLGLGLGMVVIALQSQGHPVGTPLRAASAIWNAGITATNLVFAVLAELISALRASSLAVTAFNLARFAVATGLLFAVLAMGLMLLFPPALGDTAVQSARQIWWDAHINNEQAASILDILKTFSVYNLVAPEFTIVLIDPMAPKPMIDFRQWHYEWFGVVAIGLTAIVAAIGAWRVVRDRELRLLGLVALAWLGANLLLHSYWQYRGSIYIYGAHVAFLPAILVAAALRPGGVGVSPLLLRTLVLAMSIATASNNLWRYDEMIDRLAAARTYPASAWNDPAVVRADERRAASEK